MRDFVEIDFDEKVKMGREGRRYMEEIFDKDKVVKETVEKVNITIEGESIVYA